MPYAPLPKVEINPAKGYMISTPAIRKQATISDGTPIARNSLMNTHYCLSNLGKKSACLTS